MLQRFLKATVRSFVWARDNPEEAARLHKERWPDTKYEDNLAGWVDLSGNMFGKDKSKSTGPATTTWPRCRRPTMSWWNRAGSIPDFDVDGGHPRQPSAGDVAARSSISGC